MMKYSTDRILTTHAGALPQPPDLKQMQTRRSRATGDELPCQRVREAVAEAVTESACGRHHQRRRGRVNFARGGALSGFVERDANRRSGLDDLRALWLEFGDYLSKAIAAITSSASSATPCQIYRAHH
jgi:hypothetical protein